jgi:hypothetical protein
MTEFWDSPVEKQNKLWQLEQLAQSYKDGWADGYKSALAELGDSQDDM